MNDVVNNYSLTVMYNLLLLDIKCQVKWFQVEKYSGNNQRTKRAKRTIASTGCCRNRN